MQHNFIGSMAYTAKQLQDPAFTSKYGIASTVMEYAPTNVWPRPYGQGDYSQTVLGPYDYHLMQWTYATNSGRGHARSRVADAAPLGVGLERAALPLRIR